jgi:hypothetical protein
MTHGFQQQDTTLGMSAPRSATPQQNGQKAAPAEKKGREPRSYQPRPGR